jgi:hypothetical protein
VFHIAVQQQQRLGCIGLSLLLLSVSNEWLLPWLLVMWAQSVRQAGRHGGGGMLRRHCVLLPPTQHTPVGAAGRATIGRGEGAEDANHCNAVAWLAAVDQVGLQDHLNCAAAAARNRWWWWWSHSEVQGLQG